MGLAGGRVHFVFARGLFALSVGHLTRSLSYPVYRLFRQCQVRSSPPRLRSSVRQLMTSRVRTDCVRREQIWSRASIDLLPELVHVSMRRRRRSRAEGGVLSLKLDILTMRVRRRRVVFILHDCDRNSPRFKASPEPTPTQSTFCTIGQSLAYCVAQNCRSSPEIHKRTNTLSLSSFRIWRPRHRATLPTTCARGTMCDSS